MNKLYGTTEPNLIDEAMLYEAIYNIGLKGYAAKLAKEQGIEKKNVQHLRLDFRNILDISNLDSFVSLVKLQLDNNIIEKIEGISHLVNLKWLDLSFNNIEIIENLDTLVNIEDLSLYNNRIKRIENLDNLKKLHVFSIGNNNLDHLNDIIYCRRFKKLQTLNINGNPFCSNPECRHYALAFLPSLKYLDYKLTNQDEKVLAYEKYSLRLEEFIAQDAMDLEKEEKDKIEMEEYKKHIDAFVDDLNGTQLFEQIFKEDPEGSCLLELPNTDELIHPFKDKVIEACQNLFEYGIEEYARRQEDIDSFWFCLNEAKSINSSKSQELIKNFTIMKKHIFAELMNTNEINDAEQLIKRYRDEINVIWKNLMANEISLVDQLEDVMKEFSLSLNEMVDSFLENMEAIMGICREAENTYHERMTEHCIVMIDKILRGELDDEVSEEVKMIFVDKDSLMGSLAGSHDNRIQVIDSKADNITSRIKKWSSDMLSNINEKEEVVRNRAKLTEIVRICDRYREELDALEIPAFS